MAGTDVLMGDQALATFATGGAVTGTDGITLIVNGATYDINGFRTRVSRRVFPSTPMTGGSGVQFVERVAVSRRKSIRGQIRVHVKGGGSTVTPRPPSDTVGQVVITFSTGKTWTFDVYITDTEATADSLVAGPQEVVFDFVSSGTSEFAVA